jgi:hypothetical protein
MSSPNPATPLHQTAPFVPDHAPFTPAQRAWLNGFLAAVFCRTEVSATIPLSEAPAAKRKLRDELEAMQREGGVLTRLDAAFSRDQDFKIYVQHRMTEHGAELWKWLEGGAHFYVCGDASRMAKDVDKALHQIIEVNGGLTSEAAAEYVQKLKGQKRYQRDVY